jgi:hypothetical protein
LVPSLEVEDIPQGLLSSVQRVAIVVVAAGRPGVAGKGAVLILCANLLFIVPDIDRWRVIVCLCECKTQSQTHNT